MKRIAVFGNTGGGKSTLARRLADITRLPLYPLDLIEFKTGGAKVPHEEYLAAHAELLRRDEWIIDGFGTMATAWKRFAAADVSERTPEEESERGWARAVLDRALAALAAAEERAGRAAQFAELRACLTDGNEDSYEEIGARLGQSEGAIKVAVHRLRRRFGDELRRTIGETVADPAQIDDELKHLLRSLG